MPAHFSEASLTFLRGLARHNDREWFSARKHLYEAELKAPMHALIAEINESLQACAPEHVRPPQKIMMRIYRDIRFSANKAPYKTHLPAWWVRDGLTRTTGAGFYLSIGPAGVVIAAGAYNPDKAQLLAIRRHLAEHAPEFLALLARKKIKEAFEEVESDRLARPPKGFAQAGLSEEAMSLIKSRRWGVSSTLPAEIALSSALPGEIVRRFQAAAPLVALLNAPLLTRPRKPLF